MLNIIKTTKLKADINRTNEENGRTVNVVHLECSFSNDESSSGFENNVQTTIQNKELYLKHKTEIREEIAEFMQAAYQMQDEIEGAQEATE